jgi:hypothetical protein
MRMKLAACCTLTHGKKRRRSHAAAYPQRWAYMNTIFLLLAILSTLVEAAPGSQPACNVERTAQIRFSSKTSLDTVRVAVRGNPCWEGIATVSITRKNGEILYRRDQSFKPLTVAHWDDPSLPQDAERFVRETTEEGIVGNSAELPPWEGNGDDFYEKNSTSLAISPERYESLRKQKLPVFYHRTYHEGGLDLVYDPSQKTVVIVLGGGL